MQADGIPWRELHTAEARTERIALMSVQSEAFHGNWNPGDLRFADGMRLDTIVRNYWGLCGNAVLNACIGLCEVMRISPTGEHRVPLTYPFPCIPINISVVSSSNTISVIGRTSTEVWTMIISCLLWILHLVGEPGPAAAIEFGWTYGFGQGTEFPWGANPIVSEQ
jgi:hypothetical protein